MDKKLKCIMLVDDNASDNFFHEREIKKVSPDYIIITRITGREAIDYLKTMTHKKDQHPDPIFLDLNMPGMSGWEFLQEYNQLDKVIQSRAIIFILTTSQDEADKARAKTWSFVCEYLTKPLTKDKMTAIINKYFTN